MLLKNTCAEAKKLLEQHNEVLAIRLILNNQAAWDNLELYHDRIRNQLYAIALTEGKLLHEQYSEELYQSIFAVLLLLAKCYPRNDRDTNTNEIISPISHDVMSKTICTSKGYLYDLREVSTLLKADPMDNLPFMPRELKYLTAKFENTPRSLAQANKKRLIAENAAKKRKAAMIEEFVVRFLVWNLGVEGVALGFLIPAILHSLPPLFMLTLLVLPVFVGIAAFIAVKLRFPSQVKVNKPADLIRKEESLLLAAEQEEKALSKKPLLVSSSATVLSALEIKEEQPKVAAKIVSTRSQARENWLRKVELDAAAYKETNSSVIAMRRAA